MTPFPLHGLARVRRVRGTLPLPSPQRLLRERVPAGYCMVRPDLRLGVNQGSGDAFVGAQMRGTDSVPRELVPSPPYSEEHGGMTAIWSFLHKKSNREVLGWAGA